MSITDEQVSQQPRNKEDLRELKEVSQSMARLFANLNEAIEHFHHNYWRALPGKETTIRRPYMTTLERNVLDKAIKFRDELYERYDSIAGVAKDIPLTITRESLKVRIFNFSPISICDFILLRFHFAAISFCCDFMLLRFHFAFNWSNYMYNRWRCCLSNANSPWIRRIPRRECWRRHFLIPLI